MITGDAFLDSLEDYLVSDDSYRIEPAECQDLLVATDLNVSSENLDVSTMVLANKVTDNATVYVQIWPGGAEDFSSEAYAHFIETCPRVEMYNGDVYVFEAKYESFPRGSSRCR